MSEKLKSLRELFDERAEIMAWLVLALSTVLLVTDHIDGTIWLGSQMSTLVTMLGAAHYRGVKLNGLEVGDDVQK